MLSYGQALLQQKQHGLMLGVNEAISGTYADCEASKGMAKQASMRKSLRPYA